MIAEHQPTIFPHNIKVYFSSVEDGTMKHDHNTDPDEVTQNRELWLKRCRLDIAKTCLVRMAYDRDDYRRYAFAPDDEVGVSMYADHDTEVRDALATDIVERPLFLPVGDCCALVLADAGMKKAVMLSHIGRHNIEQSGAAESVAFMMERFGSKPEDILAWLSPMVGKESYPLHAFDGKGLKEVIVEQLLGAGLSSDHIEVSDVDTAEDMDYFSHSEYLKGKRQIDGRMAAVVVIEGDTA